VNSKYLLQTPKLDAYCYNHLVPSRRCLVATRATPTKMEGTSSALQANPPNQQPVAEMMSRFPNTVPSQRQSVLSLTQITVTDSFRIRANPLEQPRKNQSQRRRSSRPDSSLSRGWKRSSEKTLSPCSRGSVYSPTQSPQYRSTRRMPRRLGPRSLNRSYRVLYQHTHRTGPRSLYVSSTSERGKKSGTKKSFSANGTML